MALAQQVDRFYSDPRTGLNVGSVRERFKHEDPRALQDAMDRVVGLEVFKSRKKHVGDYARYSSDGGYIQADITFYSRDGVPARNEGYESILTVIDVLTRYAFARPLRSKSADEVARALKDVFEEYEETFETPVREMQTDYGKEFVNSSVKGLLDDVGVKLIHSSSGKAPVVERFNRTLRDMITRWFQRTNDVVWFKFLGRFYLQL